MSAVYPEESFNPRPWPDLCTSIATADGRDGIPFRKTLTHISDHHYWMHIRSPVKLSPFQFQFSSRLFKKIPGKLLQRTRLFSPERCLVGPISPFEVLPFPWGDNGKLAAVAKELVALAATVAQPPVPATARGGCDAKVPAPATIMQNTYHRTRITRMVEYQFNSLAAPLTAKAGSRLKWRTHLLRRATPHRDAATEKSKMKDPPLVYSGRLVLFQFTLLNGFSTYSPHDVAAQHFKKRKWSILRQARFVVRRNPNLGKIHHEMFWDSKMSDRVWFFSALVESRAGAWHKPMSPRLEMPSSINILWFHLIDFTIQMTITNVGFSHRNCRPGIFVKPP